MQRYISNELTHFVGRNLPYEKQYDLLIEIIKSGWLTHPPHNPNISGNLIVNASNKISENEMYNPEVVCFCDIPINDLQIHKNKYSSFGLSFSKTFISELGGLPVRYIPKKAQIKVMKTDRKELEDAMRSNHKDNSMDHFTNKLSYQEYFDQRLSEYQLFINANRKNPNEEMRKALVHLDYFLSFYVFGFYKFYDNTLPDDHSDNYYMEREWRVIGNVKFTQLDIQRIIIPKEYSKKLREDLPEYINQVSFIV